MLALLRVRGASPWDLMGALVVQLYSPLFLSLVLGCVIGGLAGLGISHRVWDLQRVPTIMNLLRTELVFSWESVLVILFIMAVLAALVSLLGMWTFQKTAREAIRQE
jgi:ABC-type antimicrobial peptide transport system permease subunit